MGIGVYILYSVPVPKLAERFEAASGARWHRNLDGGEEQKVISEQMVFLLQFGDGEGVVRDAVDSQ